MARYKIVEAEDGFIVDGGKDRIPVRWVIGPYFMRVESTLVEGPHSEKRNLFDFYRATQQTARILMGEWQPKPDGAPHHIMVKWARERCGRTINGMVHEAWQKAIGKLDPHVVAAHKAVFKVGMQYTPLLEIPELYEDRYILGDICKYRAAAAAACQIETLSRRAALARAKQDRYLQEMAHYMRNRYGLVVPYYTHATYDARVALEAMAEWPALFSIDGAAYRSLRRTLFNLPGNIPPYLLSYLPNIRLRRPVTDRVELLTLLQYASRSYPEDNRWPPHGHVIMHARRPEILRAMKIMEGYLRTPLPPRRSASFYNLVYHLTDYPERHNGGICGLARKAVQWHRHLRHTREQDLLAGVDRGAPLPPPPWGLPEEDGIDLIPTAGDLIDEGYKMDHCVATYLNGAISGDAFFFHVAHKGNEATAMVDNRGGIQIAGPMNTTNSACQWGERRLKQWLKKKGVVAR